MNKHMYSANCSVKLKMVRSVQGHFEPGTVATTYKDEVVWHRLAPTQWNLTTPGPNFIIIYRLPAMPA